MTFSSIASNSVACGEAKMQEKREGAGKLGMWPGTRSKGWRGVGRFLLSLLPAMLVLNLSLAIGWGGLQFFNSGYRLFLSILLSLEVLLARLFENTDTGVRTVERQAWVAL